MFLITLGDSFAPDEPLSPSSHSTLALPCFYTVFFPSPNQGQTSRRICWRSSARFVKRKTSGHSIFSTRCSKAVPLRKSRNSSSKTSSRTSFSHREISRYIPWVVSVECELAFCRDRSLIQMILTTIDLSLYAKKKQFLPIIGPIIGLPLFKYLSFPHHPVLSLPSP